MYQRRLNAIHKAVNKGTLEVNVSETAFIMKMFQKNKIDFTDSDKEEINRLWCKI